MQELQGENAVTGTSVSGIIVVDIASRPHRQLREEIMATRQPRYEVDEIARRGTEIYEQRIRPLVAAGNRGKIVAIDIDTGDFELADNDLDAYNRLIVRKPDAEVWCVRIGYKAVRHFSPPLEAEET
jgi:hypothetical protein